MMSAPTPRAGSSGRCGSSGSSPATTVADSSGSTPGIEPTPVAAPSGQRGAGSGVDPGSSTDTTGGAGATVSPGRTPVRPAAARAAAMGSSVLTTGVYQPAGRRARADAVPVAGLVRGRRGDGTGRSGLAVPRVDEAE